MSVLVAFALADCGGTVEVRHEDAAGATGSGGGVVGGSNSGSGATSGTPGAGGAGALGGIGSGGSWASGGTGASGGAGAGGGGAGVGGAWGACTMTSECVVRPQSCCGACGAAIRGDAIAIRVDEQTAYAQTYCSDASCPECFTPQDPTLLATCLAGRCSVADLLALPLTECRSNQDCKLRTTSCCECGGVIDTDSIIAIRIDAEADYVRLVCDPVQFCPSCVTPLPWGANPECVGGRCTVVAYPATTPK